MHILDSELKYNTFEANLSKGYCIHSITFREVEKLPQKHEVMPLIKILQYKEAFLLLFWQYASAQLLEFPIQCARTLLHL